MNIKDMKVQANAIIERINVLDKSTSVEVNKKLLNQIHSAADEIMDLADYALLKLQ